MLLSLGLIMVLVAYLLGVCCVSVRGCMILVECLFWVVLAWFVGDFAFLLCFA